MANQKFVNGSMMLGITIIMIGLGFSYKLGSFMSAFMLFCALIFAFLTYKVFMEE